ncbi:MAG TPA: hypothetical protein VGK50_01390 [Coriobacteriia bacterium]|jgi:hypothetical protein
MFSSVSASQASEVVNLLLMLLLVPVTVAAARGVDYPGRRWLAVGFFTIAGVYVFSIAERYLFGNPVFPFKQLLIAVAGTAFAIGTWQLALALRGRAAL